MRKVYPLFIAAMILTGCAGMEGDPSLASGVKRLGGGMYSVSEMSVLIGDPAVQAARQCQMDGDKRLNITGTTTKTGIVSDAVYAVLLFRCE